MSKSAGKKISILSELILFLEDYRKILMRDYKNLVVTLLFPIVAMAITVWIAGEDLFVHYEGTKSGCFVLVSAAIWGGLFNSIQTIVRERSMVQRNLISGGMRIGCYVTSRAILQALLCIFQSAILACAFLGVRWKYGNEFPKEGIFFEEPLLEYYISLFLLMYAADAMGLMISSVVKRAETASVLAPYILIVQLIFSGILFEMTGTADKVSYVMLSRWGMEGLGSTSDLNNLPLRIHDTVPTVPHEAEDMFLRSDEHLLQVWMTLAGFAVGFILIGNIFLHGVRKDVR